MRTRLVLLVLLGAALPAFAQAPAEREKLDPRKNQKIEHLTVEDKSNRIDEVRVGGQSQSVKVQPKGAPAYEMQPTDLARSAGAADSRDSFAQRKQRVWNVFGF
jgi:hypothetical protein